MLRILLAGALSLTPVIGCVSPRERAELLKQAEELKRARARLERTVADRDASLAALKKQVEDLKALGPDRPVDLFAPVHIEIGKLSGGADYDGKPGEDGVTIYLRVTDSDGDAVKTPGRIRVQLLDNTDLVHPNVIGVYSFEDPQTLRKLWLGKFLTQHYSLRCPFPDDVSLPPNRTLVAHVEFLDFLTGRTLTTSKQVRFRSTDVSVQRTPSSIP